jgi:hypothetical protein
MGCVGKSISSLIVIEEETPSRNSPLEGGQGGVKKGVTNFRCEDLVVTISIKSILIRPFRA